MLLLTAALCVACAPLPDFQPDTQPLPSFDEPVKVPPGVTGQFRRELIPKIYSRPIRVGLYTTHRSHSIRCAENCRVDLSGKGDDYGKLPGALTAGIHSGNLVLSASQDHNYRSTANTVLISPWDPSGSVNVDGKTYRGVVEIAMRNNVLRVVNIVEVEDYLRGVVPNEIGHLDTSMFEALKAQAVAARTYAYKHFLSRSSQGFDVYADIHDQVYDGRSGESALANQAIEGSAGVVMQWNGQLIEAYYHSTCAGQTESVSTWNRKPMPYLQPLPDVDSQGKSWCALSSYSNWEVHYSWSQLTSISKRYLNTANATPILNYGRINAVTILNHNPGGRVDDVRFDTDRGCFIVKGDRNRWLFRMPDNTEKTLPSALFTIDQNAEGLTLKGRGFGHGIGLCQYGARGMAKAGYGYKEILWHYYPAVDLVKW